MNVSIIGIVVVLLLIPDLVFAGGGGGFTVPLMAISSFFTQAAPVLSVLSAGMGLMGGEPEAPPAPSFSVPPAPEPLPPAPTVDNKEAEAAKEATRRKAARLGQANQTNITKGLLAQEEASLNKPTLLGG